MAGAQNADAPWVQEKETVKQADIVEQEQAPDSGSGEASARKSGQVKWFDATRGFGFIVADDGTGDVLLHFSILREHGRRMLPEGTNVECEVVEGNRGLQASRIISFDLGTATGIDVDALVSRRHSHTDREALASDAGPLEPVIVKWFNRLKGYGFLNRLDDEADVFIHMETLRSAGILDILPGDSLSARIASGKKGLMAVEVEERS